MKQTKTNKKNIFKQTKIKLSSEKKNIVKQTKIKLSDSLSKQGLD